MFVKLHHVTHLWVFEFIMCDHYGLLFGVTKSGDAIECNWPIISRAPWFCSPLIFVLPSHCSFVWAVRLTPETYRHIIAYIYVLFHIYLNRDIICISHQTLVEGDKTDLTKGTSAGMREEEKTVLAEEDGELADVIEIEWDGISTGVAMNK